jgi:hypothetical protein
MSACQYLPKKGQAEQTPIVNKMAGTWSLLSLKGEDLTGRIHYPYDEKVQGQAVFTSEMNFSVQYYDATRPALSQSDPYFCTDPEIRIAYLSGNAYFGSYELKDDSLYLKIKNSTNPNLSNQICKCTLQFRGDTMLQISPMKKLNGVLMTEHTIWIREE